MSQFTNPATAIRLLGLDFTRATMPSISPTTDTDEPIANVFSIKQVLIGYAFHLSIKLSSRSPVFEYPLLSQKPR